jgi:REP element-mobilizing transposase RayT
MLPNRKPNRIKGYDYLQDNLYFVTSCVQDRVCCFGTIANGKMILNEYGQIAEQQWHWLGEQYPYVVLHEFVVMPNHIHGIIEINRSIVGTGHDNNGTGCDVGTGRDLSLPIKIKSLSELMGAYKTTTSKKIHLLDDRDNLDRDNLDRDRSRPVPTKTFEWQRSFHDHIIRDEKSFETISNYIANNPSQWEQDKFYHQ